MTRVLAVDPGPHVGVSYFDNTASPEWREWEETPASFYLVAAEWVLAVDIVVVENFFIGGARASSANETIEMIGVLRYLSRRASKQFVLQAPGDAKSFSTNAKLKRLGWWVPASADHARSATRHLVLYLTDNGLLSPDRLIVSGQEEGRT